MFSTLQEVDNFFKKRNELGIKPGLERIHTLLEFLGNPQKEIQAIHIAGTNGKGSTLFFLSSALRSNNYDVGIFTSPSFHGLRGHILWNEKPIGEDEWIGLFNEVYPSIRRMDEIDMAPTTFEIITALAFRYFKEKGDIVLIEAGMGGRFDTTNCFHPILSIITTISLDHTDYLGETVEEIAYHKAGIIKRKSPAIVGEVENRALSVLFDRAVKMEAPFYQFGKDFLIDSHDDYFVWKSGDKSFPIQLKMKGKHQWENSSLALKALEVLEENGFSINWKNAIAGVEQAELLGRFEVVHQNPTVIIDAAHNPDAIEMFRKVAQHEFKEERKHVIVAMFEDKDTEKMLQLLSESFDDITLTTFAHPRAWNPLLVADGLKNTVKEIELNDDVLLNRSLEKDKVYFFTGSLHFIMKVREYFRKE